MLEKDKIGLVLALVRRNATPVFCALVPQVDDIYLLARSLTSKHIFRQKQWKRAGGMNLLDSISSLCLLLTTSALHPLPKRSEARQFIVWISLAHISLVLATEAAKGAARAWIDKLCVKNGAYPPDSYPNPCVYASPRSCAVPSIGLSALAYHNAQLQASAFREEFDTEAFEDLTRPKYDMIHKV